LQFLVKSRAKIQLISGYCWIISGEFVKSRGMLWIIRD
jgi:hypothetical protein